MPCPLCRISMPTLPKKIGNIGKVGTLCRIRQNEFRQTVSYSFRELTNLFPELEWSWPNLLSLGAKLLSQMEHGNKIERISSNFNFEWTKFEFSKNRNNFESLCSNFELSIKRASDISPFHLVPRGPSGPLMFPSC